MISPRGLDWVRNTSAICTSVGIVLFWIYFFAIEWHSGKLHPTYKAFELAFWVPDLFALTPALFFVWRWGRAGDGRVQPMAAFAGGLSLFLGLMDLSFALQCAQYYTSSFNWSVDLAIGAYCSLLGGFYLWLALRAARPEPATAIPSVVQE